jgi:hypothetical protein
VLLPSSRTGMAAPQPTVRVTRPTQASLVGEGCCSCASAATERMRRPISSGSRFRSRSEPVRALRAGAWPPTPVYADPAPRPPRPARSAPTSSSPTTALSATAFPYPDSEPTRATAPSRRRKRRGPRTRPHRVPPRAAPAPHAPCASSGWRISRADREKSSASDTPRGRSNDAFTRLKSRRRSR